MSSLVERLNNLIAVSEVGCERDLYLECRDRIEALEAVSTEINWQSAFHKEHADLCQLEANNYVLKQRIKAQAAVLRGLINWYGDDGEMGTDADLHYWVKEARKALGEGKQ